MNNSSLLISFIFSCLAPQQGFAQNIDKTNDSVRLNEAQDAKNFCRKMLGHKDGLLYRKGVTCYSGSVPSGDPKRKLISAIKHSQFFVVRSVGGDVGSALDVAEVLSKGSKTVVVLDNCLSSCANYWFLGARYKVVGANDAVGFHGGPPITVDCADEKINCALLGQLFYRSRDFLKSKGLDYRILYTPPSGYDVSKRDTMLWIFPKTELMKRWGVQGILQYDIDNS